MTVHNRTGPPPKARRRLPRKALLGCGIAYPIAYVVANDVVAASRYRGYSRMDQAVSELSATGAPTRRFLVAMLPVFSGLTAAYGAGVWSAAEGRRALRAAGTVLLASSATSVAWLPFPMSSRQDIARGAASNADTGHLVLSGLTVAEIVALLGTGSGAFGRRFRAYSLTSAGVVLVSGALTSTQAAKLPDGNPTPRMGLYERTSIGAWLLWMAVLAVRLLREEHPAADLR